MYEYTLFCDYNDKAVFNRLFATNTEAWAYVDFIVENMKLANKSLDGFTFIVVESIKMLDKC